MVLQGFTTSLARSTAALMSLNSSSTLSTPRMSLSTCPDSLMTSATCHRPLLVIICPAERPRLSLLACEPLIRHHCIRRPE